MKKIFYSSLTLFAIAGLCANSLHAQAVTEKDLADLAVKHSDAMKANREVLKKYSNSYRVEVSWFVSPTSGPVDYTLDVDGDGPESPVIVASSVSQALDAAGGAQVGNTWSGFLDLGEHKLTKDAWLSIYGVGGSDWWYNTSAVRLSLPSGTVLMIR